MFGSTPGQNFQKSRPGPGGSLFSTIFLVFFALISYFAYQHYMKEQSNLLTSRRADAQELDNLTPVHGKSATSIFYGRKRRDLRMSGTKVEHYEGTGPCFPTNGTGSFDDDLLTSDPDFKILYRRAFDKGQGQFDASTGYEFAEVLMLLVGIVTGAPVDLGQSQGFPAQNVLGQGQVKPQIPPEIEAQVKESFEELDVNKDNKISLEEILPIAVKVSALALDQTLKKFDTNGDGFVYFKEFSVPENRINQQLFFNLDLNHDNQVDLENEIPAFLSLQFTAIFHNFLDVDKDGFLSLDEYEAFFVSQVQLPVAPELAKLQEHPQN